MFSFVTTAYNAAPYLAETLESVLKQTVPDWEMILLVDLGSTDDTVAIARRYAAKDARIRVIEVPHTGIYEKVNMGINEAKYDWIAALDADDVAMPHRLERTLAMIKEQPDVIGWAGYARYRGATTGNHFGTLKLGPESLEAFGKMRTRREPGMYTYSTFTFRRDLALKVGGLDPQFHAGDVEFFDRLSDYGPIITIPEVLSDYRVYTTSATVSGFYKGALAGKFVRWRRSQTDPMDPRHTFKAFLEWYATRSIWQAFYERWMDKARRQRRLAVSHLSEHHWVKGGLLLLVASVMDFSYIWNKLRGYVFRRKGDEAEVQQPQVAPAKPTH
jgi:glycosyltransferase involved in cell wall biosynthesis